MKILFTDLDGTLLTDDKRITPANYAALMSALSAGHKIVITTGRPLKSAKIQAAKLGLDGPGCYLIAYNGSLVYDCGAQQVIYELPLSREALLAAADECNRRGVFIQAYDAEDVVVEAHNAGPIPERYCSVIDMSWHSVPSFRDLTEPSPKALIIDFNGREKTDLMQQWIRENLSDSADCYYSNKFYLELVHKGMDKGSAVAAMCERLGVPIENAVAVGDEANDVSMISAAGVGVCMANGIEAAKAAADYITVRDNNHDGIVEVVEKFILS